MRDKNRHDPSILALLALLLAVAIVLFTACGTLEVGFVSHTVGPREGGTPTASADAVEEGPSIAPKTPTPIPYDYVPPSPEPAFTPVPVGAYPVPDGLHIAFVSDGDIWLWAEERKEAVPLTSLGEIEGVIKISDDGQVVAFRRIDELWAVNSDGTGERQLLSGSDFAAMEPDHPGVILARFEWVPGTHTLAFNTGLRTAGRTLNDDLRLVDADTLEQAVLLPPGEGGEFHYSPDGSQIAVVTTGDISLVDANGWRIGTRRDAVLTYMPVAMYSLDDYYARPTWAADGSSLMVAIPPADPHVQPAQFTTIWQIPTDGNPAELVTTVNALPVEDAVAFSHDLSLVAYRQVQQSEGTPAEGAPIWLKMVRLENGDWFAKPDVGTFYGWAPNSRRFAFVSGREMPHLQIGQWSGRAIPGSIDPGTPVHDARWVDAEHYLFLVRRDWELGAEGDSWDLVLADISGSSTVLVSGSDDVLAYDFAQTSVVPPAGALPTSSPTSTLVAEGSPITTEAWATYTSFDMTEYPPDTRTGLRIVDAIIEAVLSDDLEAERALVHYTTTACTTVSGLGGPPKCRADEAEGTLVEAFPVLGVEGRHVRREDIDLVFSPGSRALYAVYRVPADAYEEDYWPTGEYGVVFVHNDPRHPYPVATTFHVGDGGIVRIVYSASPVSPLELELGVEIDEFILPPATPPAEEYPPAEE